MPLSLTARYGLHRVLDGDGTFPQPAWKLDADPRISDAEILVDVERLNLDSASFRQLRPTQRGDPAGVARAIEGIVAERGKLHNPATGSGGMLVGTVREVGSIVRESRRVVPGQRIASLISLTLTPLRLDRIDGVEMHHGQVDACGTAVLFESSPFAVLPDDIPERIALAALDVAGAPSRHRGPRPARRHGCPRRRGRHGRAARRSRGAKARRARWARHGRVTEPRRVGAARGTSARPMSP